MSWKDILKLLITPREFLEKIQEKTGGEIKGSSTKTKYTGRSRNDIIDLALHHDRGWVKVKQQRGKEYYIHVSGHEQSLRGYNLSKMLEQVLEMVEE